MKLGEGLFLVMLVVLGCFYDGIESYIKHKIDHQKRIDYLEYLEKSELILNRLELEISINNLQQSMSEVDSLLNSF